MTRDTKETNTLAKTVDDEESPPCEDGGVAVVGEGVFILGLGAVVGGQTSAVGDGVDGGVLVVVGGGGAVDEEGGEAPGVADTEMASFWPEVQWLPMVQT